MYNADHYRIRLLRPLRLIRKLPVLLKGLSLYAPAQLVLLLLVSAASSSWPGAKAAAGTARPCYLDLSPNHPPSIWGRGKRMQTRVCIAKVETKLHDFTCCTCSVEICYNFLSRQGGWGWIAGKRRKLGSMHSVQECISHMLFVYKSQALVQTADSSIVRGIL
jgi:hypothetical protein